MMSTTHEEVGPIVTRHDLARFVRLLGQDHTHSPDNWAHQDIASYLEAMSAWIEDMDGFFENRGQTVPSQPTWKLVGEILLAASVYE